MESHHAASIRKVVAKFEPDPSVRALLLGGSIAHGFAKPDADIDLAIVVSEEDFARRRSANALTWVSHDICTYPGGYVDAKFMDEALLREVAKRGSEPARFAFKDAQILFSRIDGLDGLLAKIVRYPFEGKRDRMARFAAQLLGWRWFFTEGQKKESAYLRTLAVQKFVLFGCRIVLAENELLYPFHKWMLRVTLAAPRLPRDFATNVDRVLNTPTFETIDEFCRGMIAFAGLDHDTVNATWGANFMRDTELLWMNGAAPIEDW